MTTPHILFAVGSWGLGHATRCLPLLRGLLQARCRVTVVSTGRALLVLQGELGDACAYLDWPDVPHPPGRTAREFYLRSAMLLPRFFATFREERRRLLAFARTERIDRVVSDNRYGMHHRAVPSYHIGHQLRFMAPGRLRAAETLLEYFNWRWFAPVRRVLVPDDEADGLSGDLSHNLRFFRPAQLAYLGVLAPIRRLAVAPELDVFITISGREDGRAALEERLLAQLPGLERRVVVALGRPEGRAVWSVDGAVVHDYIPRRPQEEYLNRSRVVVARAGYTTIMELAVLGKRALLVPTPGQTEQEYLAAYHRGRGAVHAVAQEALDLRRDIAIAEERPGLRARSTTERAVRRFLEIVLDEGPVPPAP